MIGQTLGHFQIVEKIGAGGMGEVYRAYDRHLERDVALKILPASVLAGEAARKRFRREALALSKLNHPNIATVFDFATQDGVDFLVMELIRGTALNERLKSGSLPDKKVLRLGAQIAEGLTAAHEQGVIHRDLKPGNLMVTSDGRLKILDFGLATLAHPEGDPDRTQSLTQTASVPGTLPYMSPEQLRGKEVDARTDIYAAGAVLYELATGQRPFPETQVPLLIDAILNRAPPAPSAINRRISPGLESAIVKCVDKEPGRRYQSAKELAVDLERLSMLATAGVATHPLRPRVKNWGLLAGVALVALFAVLAAFNVGGLRDRLLGRAGPPRIESLAVLPLDNLSGDPNQEYFADGMTDDLITDLGKISALRVISRTSVMRYKGGAKPVPEIAKELGVDAVVEGAIKRSGSSVEITARLVQARTDTQLWSQTYERDLSDILQLQSEVARAIAGEIRVQLTPQENQRMTATGAVHPAAFDAYLNGRFYWEKRTREGLQKSLEYFNQGIQIDPTYAPAYAGLADTYNVLGNNQFLPPDEAFPQAKASAQKALDIDQGLAEAHASLAFAQWNYNFNWDEIEKEYKLAIALNPGNANAYHWYSGYLSGMGRHAEAIAAIKKARQLDPLSPRINANVGFILFFARQYDQAIEALQKARALDPGSRSPYLYLGMAYLQKGDNAEAIAALERNYLDKRASNGLELAYARAVAGQRVEAQKMLDGLLRGAKENYTPALYVARVYVALGVKENAFVWLLKAYDERSPQLPFLNVDPRLDPLRSDPRFKDLLRRMKLQPAL